LGRIPKIQKWKEVREMIEDAILLYLESMHRERKAKKKKGRFPF
jgi:predicted RNase H-like HicB family nuclease